MRLSARLAALAMLIGSGVLPPLASAPVWAVNSPTPAHTPVPLAAHRALYKLSLASTRGGREVTGASGTMGYEVSDVCDGWASRQRTWTWIRTTRPGNPRTG